MRPRAMCSSKVLGRDVRLSGPIGVSLPDLRIRVGQLRLPRKAREDCLGYVTMMHRAGHIPEAEATAWVQRILVRTAFLQMGTGTTPAD